jgi:hypothetical protein
MAKARVRSQQTSDAITFEDDTPTKQVVKAAQTDVFTVTTQQGRVLTVQPLAGLKRLRFLKILGAENAKNELYAAHCGLAVCVTAIDGDPVPFPASEIQLEALYQRLDDDGISAVMEAFQKRFEESTKLATDQVLEVKNS